MQRVDQKKKGFRKRLLNWLGITRKPVVKVYRGFGHANNMTIYGHVFRQSPMPPRRYRKSFVHNTWALIRLFMVKPFENVDVELTWQGQTYRCKTNEEGFYKFAWKDDGSIHKGWHAVEVKAYYNGRHIGTGTGKIYIPFETQYGFISDIDDTFLVSHSANMRKRLYVLFTQNARSRKPFDGSVKHYQLLAQGNTTPEHPNPFFYVSSSEWNLYDYIREFKQINGIPRGVLLLNQLKQLKDLLKTGQNNHQGKFTRIVRILETFPNQRFVLLGDSSQQDPYIYEAIVKHFPKQIHAVYIRDVYQQHFDKVKDVLANIELAGVPCCFFKHSSEAILHSRKIGLISEKQALSELGKTA